MVLIPGLFCLQLSKHKLLRSSVSNPDKWKIRSRYYFREKTFLLTTTTITAHESNITVCWIARTWHKVTYSWKYFSCNLFANKLILFSQKIRYDEIFNLIKLSQQITSRELWLMWPAQTSYLNTKRIRIAIIDVNFIQKLQIIWL